MRSSPRSMGFALLAVAAAVACDGGDVASRTETAVADSGFAVTAGPAEAADVTVTGRVVDAESREGVADGYVIVLAPGISFTDWEESPPEEIEDLMAGAAVTDSLGRFEVPDLPRGRDFTVVVAARGHEPAVFEGGLTVRPDDPPFTRLADVELAPR
ncbi:MAG TPA: carboxypeptidase-like regulatory domain-containing protein [Gemmatimonadota bacterium]|nr:carboxypeptidase-like regulatory domain-containing protein [Gemmatimonadota bacterium]